MLYKISIRKIKRVNTGLIIIIVTLLNILLLLLLHKNIDDTQKHNILTNKANIIPVRPILITIITDKTEITKDIIMIIIIFNFIISICFLKLLSY